MYYSSRSSLQEEFTVTELVVDDSMNPLSVVAVMVPAAEVEEDTDVLDPLVIEEDIELDEEIGRAHV